MAQSVPYLAAVVAALASAFESLPAGLLGPIERIARVEVQPSGARDAA